MKTPDNHPWKGKKKVKATCLVCDAEFDRDPESRSKTCSDKCFKQYARVKFIKHLSHGGFR